MPFTSEILKKRMGSVILSIDSLDLESDVSDDDLEEIEGIFKEFATQSTDWRPSQPSSDSRVWRYLSLTQLLSILEREQIWFTNITEFDDPYEGSLPQQNLQEEVDELCDRVDNLTNEDAELIHTFFREDPGVTNGYVNCWNINDHESAALWEQYIESSEGVAITTTVDNLEKAIKSDRDLVFGKIKYKDYEKDSIPKGKIPPIFHKRESFEHEKEFRVCFLEGEEEDIEAGDYIDVDTGILIDELYLSPTSDEWFYDLIDKTLNNYEEVDCELKQSDIYSDPVH